MAWAASVTVSPTKMLHQQVLPQRFWIYNNCGCLTKGIQRLKFISQMWVNSLKAFNFHLQSSTIKHSDTWCMSIFQSAVPGQSCFVAVSHLPLILWILSKERYQTFFNGFVGFLHWQVVFQQWHHRHHRVTTPVAAPTTAPATATAPANAVSGRSSGMAAGFWAFTWPPQTRPKRPHRAVLLWAIFNNQRLEANDV